jgi:hypothetical protein
MFWIKIADTVGAVGHCWFEAEENQNRHGDQRPAAGHYVEEPDHDSGHGEQGEVPQFHASRTLAGEHAQ